MTSDAADMKWEDFPSLVWSDYSQEYVQAFTRNGAYPTSNSWFITSAINSNLMTSLQLSSTSLLQSVARFLTKKTSSDEIYSELAMQHYRTPVNIGTLDDDDEHVGSGLVGAPACGDVMRLQIKVGDDGKISEAKFKTFGCGAAIASSSYATSLLQGKSLEEASQIKNTDISDKLGLPPVKLHCSVLAEDAIRQAIDDYKRKRGSKIQVSKSS